MTSRMKLHGNCTIRDPQRHHIGLSSDPSSKGSQRGEDGGNEKACFLPALHFYSSSAIHLMESCNGFLTGIMH
jgi:hypothetical protein